MNSPYLSLRKLAAEEADWSWLSPLLDQVEFTITKGIHGDLPRWRRALERMPEAELCFDGGAAAPVLGQETRDTERLAGLLMELHPWRKGPLRVGGVSIDTEWRSDWKWARIAAGLDIQGHRILDVGCGNGYYGWRMLHQGAERVIGIDPTLVYIMQWLACRHFAGEQPNHVLPLGIEDIPEGVAGFDSVFSMGVLYHRRDPVAHLKRLAALARPAGQVVLETLVLDEHGDRELVPGKRYARMRNVWSVPTIARLESWMTGAGLRSIQVLDITRTGTGEQRTTEWMRFESLAESLDPKDHRLTVEGHPAPVRAALLASVS